MKKVVILKIDTYNVEILKQRIEAAILAHFPHLLKINKGEKILLKPNFLMEATPEEAITTHPAILEAIAAIFSERNAQVSIADSPGGFASNKNMDTLYENLGIKRFADGLGVKLLYPDKSTIKHNLPLCWWADASASLSTGGLRMINVPKLKTHEIMVLTLATKNLYGCISGLHKSNLHRMHPTADDFANIIVLLYKIITPMLNIVDGILAMEGDGPAKKGIPRKLNVVAIGDDALYTDYVLSELLGLSHSRNPLVKIALEQGLIQKNNVEVISEFKGHICGDFVFPGKFVLDKLPRPVVNAIMPLFKFYPKIDFEKCVKCLKCKEVCPVGAINVKENTLTINRKSCIMCMCCGEMCKFGAVDIERSLVLRIIKKLSKS